MTVLIDPEFHALIPQLAPEEFSQLEANILADGCRDALVVWAEPPIRHRHKCYNQDPAHYADGTQCSLIPGDGVWMCETCNHNPEPYSLTIIDGHNRYSICQKHKLPFGVKEMKFDSREAVCDWIDANQLGRRNLAPDQYSLLRGRRYNRTKRRAEDNLKRGAVPPSGQGVRSEKTAETLAKQHGVTERTIRRDGKRAEFVEQLAKTAPSEAQAVRDGTLRISKAKRISDERDRAQKLKEAKLSTPKNSPGIDIRVADAFDMLAGLAPASVDCILTDPPYNVTEYDWDKHPSPSDYLAFIARFLTACKRVLKPDAYQFFLFCDAEYMARIEALIVAEGLPIKSRLVWVRKNMSMGRVIEDRFISQWEPIFHCGNKPLNLPAEWGSERGDVQEFAVPQTNFTDRKIHPTQKPLALVQRLVELSSDTGQLVVDPFCGGGTTAVACHLLKRNCITCDTNQDYVALAKARLHGQL